MRSAHSPSLSMTRIAASTLIAVAMLRAGLELSDDQLALAAASHSGAAEHQDTAAKILADAGRIDAHRNPDLTQVRGGSDTAEHQQFRRIDGARGHDHLTTGIGGVVSSEIRS